MVQIPIDRDILGHEDDESALQEVIEDAMGEDEEDDVTSSLRDLLSGGSGGAVAFIVTPKGFDAPLDLPNITAVPSGIDLEELFGIDLDESDE